MPLEHFDPQIRPAAMNSEAERLKNEGNARKEAGDLEGALDAYRRALVLAPDYAAALYNCGLVLQEAGRPAQAEPYLRRFAQLEPSDRDAFFRLGLVLAAQERHAEAAEAYREALRLDAGNPLLLLELARCDAALGRRREACEGLQAALRILPDLDEAHNMLGVLLEGQGDLEGALQHYRRAASLQPRDAVYLSNVAVALGLKGDYGESIRMFRSAIEAQGDDANLRRNLGRVYAVAGQHELAAEAFAAADALAPGDPRSQGGLLFSKQHLCDWARFDALVQARRRSASEHPDQPLEPFSMLSIPSTRSEQLREARAYAESIQRRVAEERTALHFAHRRRSRRRLKIGYLSADFHEHATAHLTAELYELHDRSCFEVRAYSYGPDDRSEMRARLRSAFDAFEDMQSFSHAQAARRIYDDEVDILVDLKGYTLQARTAILALRPAPVQVSYLGYPGTMGADFVDYLVADRFVIPPEHEADYSEKLVLLPGSYQVNDRKRRVGPTPLRRDLGLPERSFVFCCFNQAYKILPETFRAWMRVLQACPGAVLWLLHSGPAASANLRREAAAAGVEPERLVFAGAVPLSEHLGRLRAADLFLDTWPYNAHTSASDALWAGVPVLTCPGQTFASRVAGSLLTALDMTELIVPSVEAYEAAAMRLATSPREIAALRSKVAAARTGGSLFDTPAFTRALEEAYERMGSLAASGRSPERIDLT